MLRYVLPALAGLASAQVNFMQSAETEMATFDNFFDKGSGVFMAEGSWQQANSMTTVAEFGKIDSNFLSTAQGIVNAAYTNAKGGSQTPDIESKRSTIVHGPRSPENDIIDKWASMFARGSDPNGDWDRFTDSMYDDNGWWALAWIAAYDITNNPDHLAIARDILDQNMSKGPQTPCNGGIFWGENSKYVNAIANELYISIAAHLANRVPGTDGQNYLQLAQTQWNWFYGIGMIGPNGTINDGLDGNCHNDGSSQIWSYNQGVILGALVELNKAAPNSAYLANASSIAKAAITTLANPTTHVMHDFCDELNNCNSDQAYFKGIFMRNLLQLHLAAPDPAYEQVITASATSIISNQYYMQIAWEGPRDTNSWGTASMGSAMDAVVAAAGLPPS